MASEIQFGEPRLVFSPKLPDVYHRPEVSMRDQPVNLTEAKLETPKNYRSSALPGRIFHLQKHLTYKKTPPPRTKP